MTKSGPPNTGKMTKTKSKSKKSKVVKKMVTAETKNVASTDLPKRK